MANSLNERIFFRILFISFKCTNKLYYSIDESIMLCIHFDERNIYREHLLVYGYAYQRKFSRTEANIYTTK